MSEIKRDDVADELAKQLAGAIAEAIDQYSDDAGLPPVTLRDEKSLYESLYPFLKGPISNALQAERERVKGLERERGDALLASNEAGYAFMPPAEVIRQQNEQLEALRQAIREKAQEWRSDAMALRGSTMSGGSPMKVFEDCAAELLALEKDHAGRPAQETTHDGD